jgi:phenylalanyl-tRNA synthetase beta chain
MQFSENWLRTWANPALSSEQLGDLLTMSGLEVEDMALAAPAFSGVVVAEVLTVEPHPDADRLRVTTVNVGLQDPIQIVCGAPNVVVGAKVPCAMDGAVLSGDFKIKPTKMRGVASNGMLCSAKELGLPEKEDGLLILPSDAPIGQDIRQYLALDDRLFTLKITPNRADALSILGIAREVAALTDAVLVEPSFKPVEASISATLPVEIDAPEACGRYLGRVIQGVNAAATTPDWMVTRLHRSGVRPISAVVDVTNYVLLELGQPMHAFDVDTLKGGLHVRWAQSGESLTCLNEKTVTLTPATLLIADEQKPLALAGLMGGLHSGVTSASTNIFLESAYFTPEVIAGKSRQYGFGSDSSFRYERGVDFAGQARAMERATRLILDICGGSAGPVTETLGQLPQTPTVLVRTARVNRVLGLDLPATALAAIFKKLDFALTQAQDYFHLTAPAWRFDLAREEDYIEEIARVFGYENIPDRSPLSGLRMLPLPEKQQERTQTRRKVAERDYQEIISYAFVDEKWERDFAANLAPVRLKNPIASQYSVMRSTLIGGLVDTLRSNLARKMPRVRLFEVARIFEGESANQQKERLAGLAYGTRWPEQWGQAGANPKVDFYDVKADVEALFYPQALTFKATKHAACHPGRCADIFLNETWVGFLGELHPLHVTAYDLPAAPVVFELDLPALEWRLLLSADTPSKHQAARRDLAFVVAEAVEAGELLSCCQRAASNIVTDITLFDVYRGRGVEEGYKSLALAVTLQHTERTLTDEEIDLVIQKMISQVETDLKATLRQ